MSSAVLVQVAEVVAGEIRDHNFGLTFDVERNWADFDVELEEIGKLRCDVVGVVHAGSELDDRGSTNYKCPVDIVIRKRFGQNDQTDCGRIEVAEIDRLVLLVEQIHEFLCSEDMRRLGDFDATWESTEIRACASRVHLQKRMFLGVIRVTYDVSQVLA